MMFSRHIIAYVLLCTLLGSILAPQREALAEALPFPDLSHSWYQYRNAVNILRDRGAISGYPDGTFRPNTEINRAEFLKIVFRAQGRHDPVGRDCFPDVQPDAWYAPFVCAAARRKIVSGYPDGNFRPEQTIQFAEALKMLLRAYGKDLPERRGEKWYEPYAEVFDREGILPRHSYIPWHLLTRERAADMIVRLLRHEEERILPRLSPGCGKSSIELPSSVTIEGHELQFLLTIPTDTSSHDPSPLIVAFHGRTNSNEQVRAYMHLDQMAEEFFIAYPASLKTAQGTNTWSDTDIAFFDAIVEMLAEHYCIDMERIYVTGHSLGAWFANSIACVRGDVVRASGTVAGDSMLVSSCKGPAAALLIHNPHDTLSPLSGAERTRDMRLRENACTLENSGSTPAALRCQEYQGCDGGNSVVWCPHELDIDPQGNFYPHHWPREAAPTIIEFFRKRKD